MVNPKRPTPRDATNPSDELSEEALDEVSGGVATTNSGGVSGGHSIVSPRDHASGLATGKRTHKPVH